MNFSWWYYLWKTCTVILEDFLIWYSKIYVRNSRIIFAFSTAFENYLAPIFLIHPKTSGLHLCIICRLLTRIIGTHFGNAYQQCCNISGISPYQRSSNRTMLLQGNSPVDNCSIMSKKSCRLPSLSILQTIFHKNVVSCNFDTHLSM